MPSFIIRPTNEDDRSFVRGFITHRWHAEAVIAHGTIFYPAELPGFIAQKGKEIIGLATFRIELQECEIITLDSIKEGQGIGSELLEAVKQAAIQQGCTGLTLITTNDNLDALRFYQKNGFNIRAVFPDAILKSRELKPSIPLLGSNGIPIRDEIQLEMRIAV